MNNISQRLLIFLSNKKNLVFFAAGAIILASATFYFWGNENKPAPVNNVPPVTTPSPIIPQQPSGKVPKKVRPKPGPISMDSMKKQGCVADGLLNGYGGGSEESVYMIQRSNCKYLHRSLETWLRAPDFDKVEKIMDEINRPDINYGMFIAEALNEKAQLYYPDEDREFDFNDMCGPDTQNDWGEHTCKPNFEREEYRKYVEFITHEAMDLGIQSFEFGQIYYQGKEHVINGGKTGY